MCGIAGEINLKHGVTFNDYHNDMLKSLARRGPDDHGVYKTDNAVLLHSRLAVIDPENGKQPMTALFDNNEYTICYNGELYNTDELRLELIRLGEQFETHTDTEVVLKSYIRFGAEAVKNFNGIFAFVIYNRKEKTIFAARDKMGVKPFFMLKEIADLFLEVR